MNETAIKILLKTDIKKVLNDFGMYKSCGVKDIGDHSSAFKKISRTGNHIDIYNTAIKELDYEVLLKDDSILQFSSTRYAFIQNPNIIATREELLNSIYNPEELNNLNAEEYGVLLDSITEEEIEQFKNEQHFNLHAHMIRYDIDEKNYKPLEHAYSHFHIGSNDKIRIPCYKILTPLAFVFFVIKHTYSNIHQESYEKLLPAKGDNISSEYWVKKEELELYLI